MIGVGIVTYQRFDMFKKCYDSVIKSGRDIDHLVIIDDCSFVDKEKYDEFFNMLPESVFVISQQQNEGVGKAKNEAMRYLMFMECDHIFTIEDDMIIKSPDIYKEYIKVAKAASIHYMNFALHGPANKGGPVGKIPRINLAMYRDSVGAFTYYTKELIKIVGYHDEKFLNAWEHVEYAYRVAEAEMTTPMWMFADIINSTTYIDEQPNSIENSSIRPREDWGKNIQDGLKYFEKKHGFNIIEERRKQR